MFVCVLNVGRPTIIKIIVLIVSTAVSSFRKVTDLQLVMNIEFVSQICLMCENLK